MNQSGEDGLVVCFALLLEALRLEEQPEELEQLGVALFRADSQVLIAQEGQLVEFGQLLDGLAVLGGVVRVQNGELENQIRRRQRLGNLLMLTDVRAETFRDRRADERLELFELVDVLLVQGGSKKQVVDRAHHRSGRFEAGENAFDLLQVGGRQPAGQLGRPFAGLHQNLDQSCLVDLGLHEADQIAANALDQLVIRAARFAETADRSENAELLFRNREFTVGAVVDVGESPSNERHRIAVGFGRQVAKAIHRQLP